MANIKSQIKRNRQNESARQRNKGVRSRLHTLTKRFESTVEAGDADTARADYVNLTKALDQAAAHGIIHKNKAANKKSRLAKRLSS